MQHLEHCLTSARSSAFILCVTSESKHGGLRDVGFNLWQTGAAEAEALQVRSELPGGGRSGALRHESTVAVNDDVSAAWQQRGGWWLGWRKQRGGK